MNRATGKTQAKARAARRIKKKWKTRTSKKGARRPLPRTLEES